MRPAILIVAAVPLLLAETPNAIEGTAFNHLTHAGVAGVIVGIASTSDIYRDLYTAKTDASGSFRIEGVPEGEYKPSYQAPKGFEAPGFYNVPTFRVDPRNGPAHLSIPLIPLATIRGRVLAPDGKPVPRVQVELFRVHYAGGAFMTTDSAGGFFQDNLNPGKYRLRARPAIPGSPLAERMKTSSALAEVPPEGERWMWAPTYFPSSVEMESSQIVTIREGAELVGYDIHLRSAPAYRVRGVVVDPRGTGLAGVEVKLITEIGFGASDARVRSGEGGAFEFPAVRAGSWEVLAEVQRGTVRWSGSAKIAVPKRDIDIGNIPIGPPIPLSGIVERDVPDPRNGSQVVVRLIQRGGVRFNSPSTSEDSDHRLVFEDVYAGKYRIAPSGRSIPGYYLKSVLFGADEVLGQEVEIGAGAPPVRIILHSKAARVTGTVENGANARVILLEADQDRDLAEEMMNVATCDGQGRFTAEGLRPVTYLAIVPGITGNLETGRVLEGLFDYGLIQQAKKIRLNEGETINLKLTITPWPD